MRAEGAIRMARLRRGSGHRLAQAVPRPTGVWSDGHRTAAWTCRMIRRRRVVDRSRMAFCKKFLLDTTQSLMQTPQSR